MSLYDSLYTNHDEMLRKKQQETAELQQNETRRLHMLSRQDEIAEMPAFSAFMQLNDIDETSITFHSNSQAAEAAQAAQDAASAAATSSVVIRDGFERMRRCEI